mgnify:CR=1 FL=1
MTDMITSTTDIERHAPVVTVYTRAHWADAWTEQARLHADGFRLGSSPEGSSALLSVDVGAGWAESSRFNQAFPPLDLLGHYVKIKVQRQDGTPLPDPFYWYGIITEDGGVREGAKSYAIGGVPTTVLARTQELIAVGLEAIFDKIYVDRTYVQDEDVPSELNVVGHPITFNAPHRYDAVGNRTPAQGTAPNGENCYVFEPDLSTAVLWATRDIVEYLVNCFQPLDWDDQLKLPVVIVDDDAVLPAWDQPIVEVAASTTVRQLLDRLLDRRRLLGWTVTVDESTDPDTIEVRIISFVSVAISLPSGETQAANSDTVALDFDQALDVRASLTQSDRHRADQVIVRGARMRSCFSISHDDGTLEPDWKSNDETAYEDGPGGLTGTEAEQMRAIIEWRRRDELRQVFSYFKLPDDWNYEVGNGTGGAPSSSSGGGHNLPIDPELDLDANWIYRPELRFLRELFAEIHDTRTEDGAQDAPPPIAVIEIEDGTFRLIDKLAETAGVIDRGTGTGRTWSASVRMRDDSPGIIVRVSGAQQLVIAETDFDGEKDTDDQPTWLDWKDMIVTVAAEMGRHAEAVYPDSSASTADQKTVVLVDVGDAGRLDYVVPDTVTGVDGEGALVRDAAGGYARDDREWMRDLAKYVLDWYGVRRQAFRFDMQQILDILHVGQMIATIGSGALEEEVNSVVVGVTYDFRQQMTMVDTAFANLDSGVLVDWFRERR